VRTISTRRYEMTTRATGTAGAALQEMAGIAEQLAALGHMTVGELRERYQEVYGEPTRSRNKDYLRKQVAWRIQELAEGGLSERALARIEELARDGVGPETWGTRRARLAAMRLPGTDARSYRDERLPAVGSVITRKHKGVEHLVAVREDGFEHEGRVYTSLSQVAQAITGTHWNGYLFFGLTARKAGDRRLEAGGK
jgi:hypothetical protein